MPEVTIANIMVCSEPRRNSGRLILSASDSVWEPVKVLPTELKDYFTDELGNSVVEYGGFLQLIGREGLNRVSDLGLYSCFRAVAPDLIDYINVCPNSVLYDEIGSQLNLIGWDICCGNGWVSASSDGYFPFNSLSGAISSIDELKLLNEFSLFAAYEACLQYIDQNNRELKEDAPWYPVGLFVDRRTKSKLDDILISL